ncbi:hypothetical protein GCM10009647_024590 [Streptomyces sanglieri]
MPLGGRGARLRPPVQQPGLDQAVDRRVETAVADRPGVAGQVRDAAAELVAVGGPSARNPRIASSSILLLSHIETMYLDSR